VRGGSFIRIALAAAAGLLVAASAAVAGEKHGLSIFGDLKYPPDFKHFEYVNPDAPKGGKVSQVGPGGTLTFDSFNFFILKGDRAQGLDLLYDTLMTRAFDEPDAVYGLVAKSAEVAADGMSATFKLRPEARFADGSAVTAEDVVFSFEALKTKGHPSFRIVLRDVEKAEAIDAHTVTFSFKGDLVKPLPIEVALLPVLPKAYYATRPFEETTLERPIGSGPYKIGQFSQGRYVSYERRDDYWAKDLPVNRGRFNFDEVRYDYFRDRTLELEALFARTIDFREEFTSKDWATGYDKPMV
jgi:microcin C transport system substrate-binding protein